MCSFTRGEGGSWPSCRSRQRSQGRQKEGGSAILRNPTYGDMVNLNLCSTRGVNCSYLVARMGRGGVGGGEHDSVIHSGFWGGGRRQKKPTCASRWWSKPQTVLGRGNRQSQLVGGARCRKRRGRQKKLGGLTSSSSRSFMREAAWK